MKKIITALLSVATLISAAPPQGESNTATGGVSSVAPMVFSCLCAAPLQSAFKSIRTHVITDNLTPVKTNLVSLNEIVSSNIAAEEAKQPLLKKSNEIYAEKIIEAKKILFRLEQQSREKSAN